MEIAQEALRDLQKNDTPQMRNQIVRTAQGQGFWSIWMTVFQNDPDMLNRLIDAFLELVKVASIFQEMLSLVKKDDYELERDCNIS